MRKLMIKPMAPLLARCVLTGLLVGSLCTATGYTQGASPISILNNGRLMRFDVPPIEMNGRVLVPLRGVFEGLGATVDFDAATNNIFATRGDTRIQLRVGSADASVNGVPRILDVPAQTYGGRTLVPLRFVSEALGANVNWNAAQRAVYLTPGAASSPVTPPGPEGQFPPASEATTTITGTVLSVRPNGRVVEIQTDAGSQPTVRLEEAPKTAPQAGDRVQVSGTMRGRMLNASDEDFVILKNREDMTLNGRILSFQDNGRFMVESRGMSYSIEPNAPLPDRLNVGDMVRVSGRADGTTIRDARVTRSRRMGRGDGNRNDGGRTGAGGRNDDRAGASQPVSFTGSVDSFNPNGNTVQVRGDNGQTYTLTYAGNRDFRRGDRVKIVGTYSNGVTTATSITRID